MHQFHLKQYRVVLSGLLEVTGAQSFNEFTEGGSIAKTSALVNPTSQSSNFDSPKILDMDF